MTVSAVELAGELESQLVAWRRDFHRHPEPGFGEFRTASVVARELAELGYDVRVGADAMDSSAIHYVHRERVEESYARALEGGVDRELLSRTAGGLTGVVADLRLGEGPTVALRVDMDALPVTEAGDPGHRPAADGFASTRPGYMHACGHDGHMAVGLGVATVLARLAPDLCGTVRLVFQPAEEGALGGAAAIAAKGLVDDVDSLLCFHLGLGAESGHVVSRAYFLATSKYRVIYTGAAAHVTNSPQSGRNALLAAASAALALHSIPPSSRGWFSLNVGVLHAGEEQGVTPRLATMDLGFWAETEEVHDYVAGRVQEVLHGTAAAWGVDADVRLIGQAPTASQDAELAALAREAARSVPGVERVEDEVACRAGEDACTFLRRVTQHGGQGIYMLVGSRLASGHHTPTFDFDERSLVHATAVLGQTASALLSPA